MGPWGKLDHERKSMITVAAQNSIVNNFTYYIECEWSVEQCNVRNSMAIVVNLSGYFFLFSFSISFVQFV